MDSLLRPQNPGAEAVIDFSAIEPVKENIQPLKKGRKVASLEKCAQQQGKVITAETAARYEAKKEAFEKQIAEYAGEDPLPAWLEYIGWIQETYVAGGLRSPLLGVLERCTAALKDHEQYRNSEKFLKVWILYADLHRDPEDVFKFLVANNLFPMVAMFYRAYSLVLLRKGRVSDAENTILRGIEVRAEPVASLRSELAALPGRAAALRAKRVKCTGDDDEPPRAALQPAVAAPSIRGLGGIRSRPEPVADENLMLGDPVASAAERRAGAISLRPAGAGPIPTLIASASTPAVPQETPVPQPLVIEARSTSTPLELIKRVDEGAGSNFTIFEEDVPSQAPSGFGASARFKAMETASRDSTDLGVVNDDGEFVLDETKPLKSTPVVLETPSTSIQAGFGPLLVRLQEEEKKSVLPDSKADVIPEVPQAAAPSKGWTQLAGMHERSKENSMPSTKWSELTSAQPTVVASAEAPSAATTATKLSTRPAVRAIAPVGASGPAAVLRPVGAIKPVAVAGGAKPVLTLPVTSLARGTTTSASARPQANPLGSKPASVSAGSQVAAGFATTQSSGGFTVFEDDSATVPKAKAASLRRL